MDTRRKLRTRPDRSGSKGFTLVDLGLAIGIGIVLMYAGMLAFDSARDAAGDAISRQKVADLQGVVEQDFTANHYFPALNDLRPQWLALRPLDATASPWGGPVTGSMADDGIEGGDLEGPNSVMPGAAPQPIPDKSSYYNVVYYYRINVPGQVTPPCCWSFQDDSKGPAGDGVSGAIFTQAAGYMVGANKEHHCFYFVTSGRTVQ